MGRLRLAPRPRLFAVRAAPPRDPDRPTTGQRMAERVAASVGSWWFLGGQAGFLVLWLIYNTLQATRHFDPPPYILLNLLLSFQAAFTGPVLLIAANVGAMRDHAQADRIEKLTAQNEQLAEQNVQLVDRLFSIEQLLEEHVNASLAAHTAELRELKTLVREVHVAVCATSDANGADDNTLAAVVATTTAPAAAPAAPGPVEPGEHTSDHS